MLWGFVVLRGGFGWYEKEWSQLRTKPKEKE